MIKERDGRNVLNGEYIGTKRIFSQQQTSKMEKNIVHVKLRHFLLNIYHSYNKLVRY